MNKSIVSNYKFEKVNKHHKNIKVFKSHILLSDLCL